MSFVPGSSARSTLPGRLAVEDRPRVLHSHDYSAALLRSLLETDRIDAAGIVENAAAELAFEGLSEHGGGAAALEAAAELFRESGLGVLDLSGVGEDGGEAVVVGSHFAGAWRLRYGSAGHPVCAMPAGFVSGSLAAAFGRHYQVVEVACAAQDRPVCRFRATPTDEPPRAAAEVLLGAPLSLPPASAPAVDEEAIVAALLGTAPGADSEGRILALGGSITRLWADYYTRVCYRFEREVPRVLGAKFGNLPSLVLTEAGHSYAFHTFGRLLSSEEWAARVAPLLSSREEWFHAAVAVVNVLGWGTWRVTALVPGERASVRVHDSYEALGLRRQTERSGAPRCYLARGTLAALMNLLYVGDPTTRPTLDASYYNRLFRSPLSFRAVETRCRSMDDPYCELIANPLSPGLSARGR
jgi:predicted hydrocarbon binding protein